MKASPSLSGDKSTRRPLPMRRCPVALSVAGSDSGGGAGVQADLKTFAALGVFGTSAITCLTAQNPDEVSAIEPVSPSMLQAQIEAVFKGFPVAAVKTGMLYSADLIEAAAEKLAALRAPNLVLDPVMVSTSGARLLREDAMDALRHCLLPICRIVTPNLPEAEILSGLPIRTTEDQCRAARAIAGKAGTACVVKGGHFVAGASAAANPVSTLTDILVLPDGSVERFETTAIDARETHGTGCTFSAVLAASLALGAPLAAATAAAQAYVAKALANAVRAGNHFPLGWGAPLSPNPDPVQAPFPPVPPAL